MATLKSIKNKYLSTADGSTLGVDQNKDNVSLLAFKMAAADSIAKFDMRDGMYDTFTDATGVDAGNSTNETRDASGKYYMGQESVTPSISGDYESSGTDGAYSWYKWTTVQDDGTFTTDTAQDYEYLVIGGGASGMRNHSGTGVGGGGAGGYRTATGFAVAATTITGITVGAGGTNIYGVSATAAEDSVFSTITSTAGGTGGYGAGSTASDGGSGGGGGSGYNVLEPGGAGNAGSYSPVEGYAGGNGQNYGGGGGGGGGGGAGGVGSAGSSGNGGSGGSGATSSIDGSSTTRAGGGGGNGGSGSNGSGGSGGGGAGSKTGAATAGTANTGSGGGAARGSYNAGAGGSGIVIIRRLTGPVDVAANMTLVSNATTAQAQPDTADLVLTYTNGAGTATINTDLKAYVSRDNGTTYTETTLVNEGTTGGDTILAARRVDISGQSSGTSMRYKVTTHNQSVSKQTRVMAASLAWA